MEGKNILKQMKLMHLGTFFGHEGKFLSFLQYVVQCFSLQYVILSLLISITSYLFEFYIAIQSRFLGESFFGLYIYGSSFLNISLISLFASQKP